MINLNNILQDPDKVTILDEKTIEAFLNKVILFLKKEKALVELDGNVTFIGDTHGDFETTKAIIERFFEKSYLVFLGDYIDREPIKWGSIYNITYLLFLKSQFPKKIILLKGNHECNYAIPCYPYEFEAEIIKRFGSSKLHDKFIEVFKEMPLMVLVDDVFAAHGGFLKGANLEMLKTLNKNDIRSIESLVWSDPIISQTYRGAGDQFKEKDLTDFLKRINANVFIRGHDYNTLGMSIYEDRCLTIFSSQRYQNMGNGGILVAKKKKKITRASELDLYDYSSRTWRTYKAAKR